MRTLSAPIHFPNSTGTFDHRAILIWGDRAMAGEFLLEQLESSFSFPVKGARKLRPNSSKPPVAQTDEHPLLHLRMTILHAMISLSTNVVHNLQSKD